MSLKQYFLLLFMSIGLGLVGVNMIWGVSLGSIDLMTLGTIFMVSGGIGLIGDSVSICFLVFAVLVADRILGIELGLGAQFN